MSQQTTSVTVRLIGYAYRFSCLPSERDELLEAARCLDEKMQEIRDHGGRTLTLEAIALMAALNLSHELLRQQRQSAETGMVTNRQVEDLLRKVDGVLSKATPVEL